jgi:integrase
MYQVVGSDLEAMRGAGFASVAHVPFLLHEDGHYPAEANRYLRARALCEWRLRMGSDAVPSDTKRKFLTAKSCFTTARRLASFLSWCERTGRDWRNVNYRDDVLAWQEGLRTGTAAEGSKPLEPETINSLVAEACYFLTWAAEVPKNLGAPVREGFSIPITTSAIKVGKGDSAKSHRQRRDMDKRIGALVRRPRRLDLPSPSEVGRWMRAMRARFEVKALMAELMLETGIRISECNQWRIDTLPPLHEWKVRSGRVAVWLRHGVKGPKVHATSTEAVRPREIWVPLSLAERMDHYRDFTRLYQLRQWIRAGETKSERDRRARAPKPERLWLSEASHQPFSNVQLYRAWTEVAHCPAGWHPHSAREYFAVQTVVEWARNDLEARRSQSVPDLSWLQGVMRDQVRLLLSPLLGHLSEETTLSYLRAAHFRLTEEIGHPALRWQEFCDKED